MMFLISFVLKSGCNFSKKNKSLFFTFKKVKLYFPSFLTVSCEEEELDAAVLQLSWVLVPGSDVQPVKTL